MLSLEQEGLLNDLDSSGNLLNSLDDDTFFGSESSSHTDEDHSVISSSDSDKWNAPTEEPAYVVGRNSYSFPNISFIQGL